MVAVVASAVVAAVVDASAAGQLVVVALAEMIEVAPISPVFPSS